MLEPGVEPTGTAETRDASISKRANEASVYERDQHSHRLSIREAGLHSRGVRNARILSEGILTGWAINQCNQGPVLSQTLHLEV